MRFRNCDVQSVAIPLFCTLFCSGIFILFSLHLIHVMKPFVYLQNLLKTSNWKQRYGTYEL